MSASQTIDVVALVDALHARIAQQRSSAQVQDEIRAELIDVHDALHEMELTRVISAHLPIVHQGLVGRIIGIIQKVVRRLLRWYINPIVEQQNMYNDAVMRTIREIVALYESQTDTPATPPTTPNHTVTAAPTAAHAAAVDRATTIQQDIASHEAPLSPHLMALVQLAQRRTETYTVVTRWPFPHRHMLDTIANAIHAIQRRGLQWYVDPIVAQMNAHNRASHQTLQRLSEYLIARPASMNTHE